MIGVSRQRLTVYLHVGPPKTGSTYLQDVLWRNRSRLRSRGLTLPGSRPLDHFHAALDLRGIAFGGYSNPKVAGAWDRLAAKALRSESARAVISHEVLAGATVAEVERAVGSLAPAEVHVVYGARDLARQLPAVWQESLKNRRTRSYDAFLDGALRSRGDAAEPRGFWRAQDPVVTLRRWATAIPTDLIHLMTLPHSGAPATTLWQRFCAALELDGSDFDLDVARSNPSLPWEDAEVLRRLNAALPSDLGWPAYEHLVKRRFNARANSAPSGSRLVVPREYTDVVRQRAYEMQEALGSAGYAVSGALDDLLPEDASFGDLSMATPDKVTDAAVDILAGVLTEPGGRRPAPRSRPLAHTLLGRLGRR
jgi:hypothetical protein